VAGLAECLEPVQFAIEPGQEFVPVDSKPLACRSPLAVEWYNRLNVIGLHLPLWKTAPAMGAGMQLAGTASSGVYTVLVIGHTNGPKLDGPPTAPELRHDK